MSVVSALRNREEQEPQGRRFTQMLFGVLPSIDTLIGRHGEVAPPATQSHHDVFQHEAPVELADRPEMQSTLALFGCSVDVPDMPREIGAIPEDLIPAPGRMSSSDQIEAAGFVDRLSASVGVDIACWKRPPSERVDECTWRRVFTWVVASDRDLGRVVVLSAPTSDHSGMVASYGYEAEGVPGVGVLRVTPLTDGRWRIVDCWGDASDACRVEHLAAELAGRG